MIAAAAAPPAPTRPSIGALEQEARALVELARRADSAVGWYSPASSRRAAALDALITAIDDFCRTIETVD